MKSPYYAIMLVEYGGPKGDRIHEFKRQSLANTINLNHFMSGYYSRKISSHYKIFQVGVL